MLTSLTEYVIAVGALGTASFALVDSTNAVCGGVSNLGFIHVERAIGKLFERGDNRNEETHALTYRNIIHTLKANWLNGVKFDDQTAIAKTLIKLRLNENNAAHLSMITSVDEVALTNAILKMNGKPTTWGKEIDICKQNELETDAFGRFDLLLSTIINEGYQRADQAYKNSAKSWSYVVAIGLAWVGGLLLYSHDNNDKFVFWQYLTSLDMLVALMTGFLATPLAPISKDLASALATAVSAIQTLKK